MSRARGGRSLGMRMTGESMGEGGLDWEGDAAGGGRSELERRRPRVLMVRGGRMLVDDARCLVRGGGAREAMYSTAV